MACGKGLLLAAIIDPDALPRAGPSDSSRAAGGSAVKKVFFTPFRSGTAHVVLFRPVFPDRSIPGWAQKCHQRSDGAAEKGNQNGRAHRERSVGSVRTTQSLLSRSSRMPRSSSSRFIRRIFELAIASIIFLK
jgi:hypothetical protein